MMRLTVVMRPSDLMRRFQNAEPVMEQEFGDAATEVAFDIQREARQNLARVDGRTARTDTGDLSASLAAERLRPQPGVLTGARVFSNKRHAVFVDVGTRPHVPPLEPIRQWVRRRRSQLGIASENVERVAFFVRQKIAREGTPETRFFRDAVEKVAPRAQTLFQRALDNVMRRLTQ